MQIMRIPYTCSDDDAGFIRNCRRIYSAAVRSGYTNASDINGTTRKQKELRDFLKARFSGDVLDAWSLHCATLEAMDLFRQHDGKPIVFGSKAALARRRKGLISNADWKECRLRPLTTRGDKNYLGNRHFRFSLDTRTCIFRIYERSVRMYLPEMTGNAGEVLRQAADLAAAKKINLTFRIDAKYLHVSVDPADLPDHPERRDPIQPLPSRAVGIDLNPNWIGLTVVENREDPTSLVKTHVLDQVLIKLNLPADASAETVRATLSAVCRRAIGLARQYRAGTIGLESGLGKLRSAGKNRSLNRLLNYWARAIFGAQLRRKAHLAGLRVVEVWGGYSTTIGNVSFELPDACAAAAEIGRRVLAKDYGFKDVLPGFDAGWLANRWKDRPLPVEVKSWADVHRIIKAAKLGVRRPHPEFALGPVGLALVPGYAGQAPRFKAWTRTIHTSRFVLVPVGLPHKRMTRNGICHPR